MSSIKEALRYFWNDKVWSKVIASLILILVIGIFTYTIGDSEIIFSKLDKVIQWLNKEVLLDQWVIISLILVLIAFLFLTIKNWFIKKESSEIENSFLAYKSDIFFGLKWYWTYNSSHQIKNLHAVCVKCEYEISIWNLLPNNYYSTEVKCEECENLLSIDSKELANIRDRVYKKIYKKLRTNAWTIK